MPDTLGNAEAGFLGYESQDIIQFARFSDFLSPLYAALPKLSYQGWVVFC